MEFILIGLIGFVIGWLFCAKVLHHHEVNVIRRDVGLPVRKLNKWR